MLRDAYLNVAGVEEKSRFVVMKKLYAVIIFLLGCGFCGGQNLVPNGSFENHIACPHSYAQFNNYVSDWTVWKSNPDYWNACDTGTIASVPYNCGGYQEAATGSAYVGIHTYSGSTINPSYREYFGVGLISPLIIGTKYFALMKVSPTFLDTNCTTDTKDVSNKLGFLFSTVSYSLANPLPVPNFAHIYENAIIGDTANWTAVIGSFIADSAYQFVAIGNFFEDSLTSFFTMHPSGHVNMSYYYIDDVCVSTDSLTCNPTAAINEPTQQQEITVSPNPFTSNLTITLTKNKPVQLTLYDLTTRKLLQQTFTTTTTINTSHLAKGIYIYEVRDRGGVIGKGNVVKE